MQILRGRWVVTDADLPQPVLRDSAVLFEGDTIVEIGPWNELSAKFQKVPVLGSERHAIMPGLINPHHHSFGVPWSLRGLQDNWLELWLQDLSCFDYRAATPRSIYLRGLMSAASLLRTGVTSTIELTITGGDYVHAMETQRQLITAYRDAGLRYTLAPGVVNQSFPVNGEGQDEAFIASLPKDLAELTRRQKLPDTNMPEEEYLEVIKDLHCEFDGHDAIDVWFGPQGPQWTSRGLLEKIIEQAESLGTNIQTHVLESYIDKIEGYRSYGKSTIAYLDELGFLSPRLSMAHGTWLSQSDIETLAVRGVNLVHCPSSNLRARQGIAPLNAVRQAGLLVTLGMDGLTINDDDDLFNEMRLALRLHRTPEYNGRAPTIQESSRPGESHPEALTEPCLNLSAHTAPPMQPYDK